MAVLIPAAIAAASSIGGAGAIAGAASGLTIGGIGLGTIASAVGTGLSAIGAIKSGNAKAAANSYNAAISAQNAITAKQNSDAAGDAGNKAVAAMQAKNRAEYGAIKAGQAGSGVDMNSGSFLDVQTSAAETGQLNAINIRADATRKAYGYQTDAAGFEAQSNLDKMAAKNDKTEGMINAGSTILGGAAKTVDSYNDYLRNGGL